MPPSPLIVTHRQAQAAISLPATVPLPPWPVRFDALGALLPGRVDPEADQHQQAVRLVERDDGRVVDAGGAQVRVHLEGGPSPIR